MARYRHSEWGGVWPATVIQSGGGCGPPPSFREGGVWPSPIILPSFRVRTHPHSLCLRTLTASYLGLGVRVIHPFSLSHPFSRSFFSVCVFVCLSPFVSPSLPLPPPPLLPFLLPRSLARSRSPPLPPSLLPPPHPPPSLSRSRSRSPFPSLSTHSHLLALCFS